MKEKGKDKKLFTENNSKYFASQLPLDFQQTLDPENLRFLRSHFEDYSLENVQNVLKNLKDILSLVIPTRDSESLRGGKRISEFLLEQGVAQRFELPLQLREKEMQYLVSLLKFFEEKLEMRDYIFTNLPNSARVPLPLSVKKKLQDNFVPFMKEDSTDSLQELIKGLQEHQDNLLKEEDTSIKSIFIETLYWDEEPPLTLIPEEV